MNDFTIKKSSMLDKNNDIYVYIGRTMDDVINVWWHILFLIYVFLIHSNREFQTKDENLTVISSRENVQQCIRYEHFCSPSSSASSLAILHLH